MVSNTQVDGQIVVSKETTPTSSPKNTYGSNNDLAESSSSRTYDVSKNTEQMKSFEHPDGHVENKGVVEGNQSSVNEIDISAEAIIAVEDINDEEEVNVCDTCGDAGYKTKLIICKCGVGAEHTYCMDVKREDVPEEWSCYDCVEKANSIKMEMAERAFKEQNDLNTLKSHEAIGLDLNIDPDLNLNRNFDLNLYPTEDMNANPNPNFNLDNLDPNLDLNVDLNLDLTLDCGSSYRSSSASNPQDH